MLEHAPHIVVALLLDRLLGEPPRWHPLVGFGWLASRTERICYGPLQASSISRMVRGGIGTLLLLGVVTLPFAYLSDFLAPVVLYLAVGGRSLTQHAQAVAHALEAGDLSAARQKVGYLVSRDVQGLDETGVAVAATESVLENGCDAVFGAIFWFLLLGGPGVVFYRCANTLDAMWGYRTPQYLYFGRFAARLDDVLNYIPARLTVLTYGVLGHTAGALRAWRQQGHQWYSPNAGPVMAAGAGALGVTLGGAARYHGAMRQRPVLGSGPPPGWREIYRALDLVNRGAWLWAVLALLVWGVTYA